MAFLCDAIYRGSQIVEGAVSPPLLTSLAEVVLNANQSIRGYAEVCIDKLPRGERCQLQIDEERLRVGSSRKDEGFESDSESSSTSSTTGFEETLCGSPEIKVIKDHVMRLEKLIRQDSGIARCISQHSEDGGSTSLSSSSGAESEEESPRKVHKFTGQTTIHSLEESFHDGEQEIFRKLSQTDSNNGDNFLMSDILFCHVLSHRPKIVIVVVKSADSSIIAAHVFECLSSEAARTLYNCYYTASNKYKLNRYRLSRRRHEVGDSSEKATLDRIHVSMRNIKKKNSPDMYNKFDSGTFSLSEGSSFLKLGSSSDGDRSRRVGERNDDTSNINIIEITEPKGNFDRNKGMMQRTDVNGVTHIEIESAPCSLVNVDTRSNNKSRFCSSEFLSALDRLSIHSSNNPDSYLNHVGVTSSCPNSLIQTSRGIAGGGEKDKERRSRQRHPPLLLKKDTFRKADSLSRKEVRKRTERRTRSRSEEGRKVFEAEQNSHQNIKNSGTVDSLEKLISETSSLQLSEKAKHELFSVHNKPEHKSDQEAKHGERQSRSRNTSRPRENRSRPRSSHNKGPAPPPPPRRHPSNPSLMLVPTKSGQEKTRSYYPKESHIIRGSKVVRIDHSLYPPWNINSDVNNNPNLMFYTNRGWFGAHEFHSSGRNEPFAASELRKRSRSKSPARKPVSHRYIDAVSTFNLTQKLKDFSDSVLQTWKTNGPTGGQNTSVGATKDSLTKVATKKEKINPPLSAIHFTNNNNNKKNDNSKNHQIKGNSNGNKSQSKGNDEIIRPVIKRGRKPENSMDAKRVTFSAYATVQLMDS